MSESHLKARPVGPSPHSQAILKGYSAEQYGPLARESLLGERGGGTTNPIGTKTNSPALHPDSGEVGRFSRQWTF